MNSILEKLKGGYYFFEDKYYALLDRIDTKVPVYKIIDPIDKIFPSFVLLLIIIAALVIFLLLPVISGALFGAQEFRAGILVVDETETPVTDALVKANFLDANHSGRTDNNGEFSLIIPQREIDAKVSVEKTGFITQNNVEKTLSFDNRAKIILKRSAVTTVQKYNLTILDSETNAPITSTSVHAVFHCSGSAVPPSAANTTNGQILNIVPGNNCVRLSADFTAEGYESKTGFQIMSENTQVRMDRETGSVEVTVTDPHGAVEDAEVSLFKPGYPNSDSGTTGSDGDYLFENVSPGTYKASASSGSRNEESEEFSVEAGETTAVSIELPAAVPVAEQKKIFVKIIDSNSQQPVSGAKIIVFTGTSYFDPDETDSEGEYSREDGIDPKKAYSIAISKAGYVTKILSPIALKSIDDFEPTKIAFDPLKADKSNYGEILVHVFDEENKAVANAKIYLSPKNNPGLIVNYPYSLTNSDGNALLTALPAGDYNVRAEIGSLLGEATVHVENKKTSFVNIRLVLTEGTLVITTREAGGTSLIQNATVTIYDSATRAVLSTCTTGTTGTANGKCESTGIKSTTLVFAKATAGGYLPAYGNAIAIVKGQSTQIIELVPESNYPSDADILVEFSALCSNAACTGTKVNKIDSSTTEQTFYAKFNLILPQNADYSNIAEYFNAGLKSQLDLPTAGWRIQIISASAPASPSIRLARCMDSADYYSTPSSCAIEANSKQAVITWNSLGRGIVPIMLKIRIEAGLADGTEIEMRTAAKAEVAGEDVETPEYLKTFFIGQNFCSSTGGFAYGLVLHDSAGAIIPLIAKTHLAQNSDYFLDYVISNCSSNSYSSATLNVKNIVAAGTIDNKLKLSAGDTISGFDINAFSGIPFPKNSELLSSDTGLNKIKITPQSDTTLSAIKFSLITTPANSDSSATTSRDFFVEGAKELEVLGLPASVSLSSVPQDIQIGGRVQETLTAKPIAGAKIKIKKPDNTVIAETDSASAPETGVGIFGISFAQENAAGISSITVQVEKPGYRTFTTTIPVLTSLVFVPVIQDYGCIKINDASVLQGLTPQEFVLAGKAANDFLQAKISTACNEKVRITLSAMDAPALPIIHIAGASAGSDNTIEMEKADEKTVIIGSSSGIQGEYPIVLRAKLASETANPEGFVVAKIFARFSKTGGDCLALQETGSETDKFVFNFQNQNSDSGKIKNSCSVSSNDSKYPDAGIFPSTVGSMVRLAKHAFPEQAIPVSATLEFYDTVKQTLSYSNTFSAAGDGLNFSTETEQAIDDIPQAALEVFKTGNTIDYKATSSSPKVTVFADSADSKIKAVLNASQINRAEVPITISKVNLAGQPYGLLAYADLARPGSFSMEKNLAVSATITAYSFSNNALQQAVTRPVTGNCTASGGACKIGDLGGLGLSAGYDFFAVTGTSSDYEVFFKKDGLFSNIVSGTSAEIFAVTQNYTNVSKDLDIAFVVDTSGSMDYAWRNLCHKIIDMQAGLYENGFNANIKIYPMAAENSALPNSWIEAIGPCASMFSETPAEWAGNIAIQSPADNKGDKANGGYDHNSEAWGPAMQDVISKNSWRTNSNRIIIGVVDNDPTGKRCADYYENYECSPQWRISADGTSSIGNEIAFVDQLKGAANSAKAKLFFFYGFPINSTPFNEYPNKDPNLNDVFEMYNQAAKDTGGYAESFGGETGGERLLQMVLKAALPVSAQAFQLRLDAGEQGTCLLGSLVGYTGADNPVIPRVKFNWDWRDPASGSGLSSGNPGIATNACDSTNPKWIYCDQAQFYISLLKKLYTISEWNKEGKIGDHIEEAGNYRNFDAFLIEDNYTGKFRKDFVNYYKNSSFFNTPSWLADNPQEKWGEFFAGTGFKVYLDGTEIPSEGGTKIPAGKYRVTVNIAPLQYNFFSSGGEPDVAISVNLKKWENTPESGTDNPFYHMAVDGLIGAEAGSGSGRENYGTQFTRNSNFWIAPNISTDSITSGKKPVDFSLETDFKKFNAGDLRARVLKISFNPDDYSGQSIDFLPGYAAPVIAEVRAKNGNAALDYSLADNHANGTPIVNDEANGFGIWAGFASTMADNCKDFSGNKLYLAQQDSLIDGRLSAGLQCNSGTYGFFWDKIQNESTDRIFLNSIFFNPIASDVLLKKNCSNEKIQTTYYAVASNNQLTATNAPPLSLVNSPFKVEQLSNVFSKIESRQICVSADAGSLEFWWNPEVLQGELLSKLGSGIPENSFCS